MILGLIWRSLPVTKEDNFALRGAVLEAAIEEDIAKGYIPIFVIGTVGTTNTGAVDRIDEVGAVGKPAFICRLMDCSLTKGSNKTAAKYPTVSFYVDAAWAGVALACPEYRDQLQLPAINQYADAFSTNFHKWGGVNFDCSVLCGIP